MSIPRFFVPELPQSGLVDLEPGDALHAVNVLRLGIGDDLALFDGKGGLAKARIACISKKAARAEVVQRTTDPAQSPIRLELLVALPKGDRQRTLTDSLNQLGAKRLTPLTCSRSVAKPTDTALERIRRAVIESCKQCQRNVFMEVTEPISVEQLAEQAAESHSCRLFAHPYGSPLPVSEMTVYGLAEVRCAIGPEGGFSEQEATVLRQSGWQQVSLGGNILRVETAAIAVAAYFMLAAMAKAPSPS